MLFLLPFVRQTRKAFPDARLTLMLKWPWQGQFFENLGVDDIVYSHFSAKQLPTFLTTLNTLKKHTFDVCFAPFGSAEDTLISARLSARNKVAFASDNCGVAFTHTVAVPTTLGHVAAAPLALLSLYLEVEDSKGMHTLIFSDEELGQGEQARQQLCASTECCIAFFRGARGKKQLSDEVWQHLLEKFEAVSSRPITWVEILSPEVPTPMRDDIKTYRSKSLRQLASFLGHTDGFLCCDTGPLHLADAANARCFGVYTHSSPVTFGLFSEGAVVIQNVQELSAQTEGALDDIRKLEAALVE